MSYIALSRREMSAPHEVTVCITDEEAEILLPYFKEIYKKEDKKYQKWLGLCEIGEATNAQQDKMTNCKYRVEAVGSIINNLSIRIDRVKKGLNNE